MHYANLPVASISTLCTPLDKLPSHKHKNVEIVESYHVQSTLCAESTVNFCIRICTIQRDLIYSIHLFLNNVQCQRHTEEVKICVFSNGCCDKTKNQSQDACKVTLNLTSGARLQTLNVSFFNYCIEL